MVTRPPSASPSCRSHGSRAAAPAVPGLLVAAAVLAGAGCGKKDGPGDLAPAASALAPSKAEPAAGAVWHYVVDDKSTTHVDMPGVKEHIQGDTTAARGSLDVSPKDLTKSRGVVRVDLASFATHTFGNGDDATQTEHARTWLEVVVGGKANDAMRWAEFAIRGIDGVRCMGIDSTPATDLATVPPVKDGADDVRTVSMTVHGDVLVHGHTVPKDVAVDVAFHYPPGAPADTPPARVEIKSRQPMRLVLKDLDVRPRDPAGQLLDWTAKLVSKVAETADVTVDVVATPAPAVAAP